MSRTLNAGIIGLGVGERHIAGYEITGRCRVTTLCDWDGVRFAEMRERYPDKKITSWEDDVLSDPEIDVVSIASYDQCHAGQILKAIRNGKHVFVEKPVCVFESELEEICAELRVNRDIRMSSNLILRHVPRFVSLKQRITEGDLGSVYYMEGDYDYGRLEKITKGWRSESEYYSVALGGGIHLIDLLKWLHPVRIRTVCGFFNNISTKATTFRSGDLVVALLQYDDDVVAKITANFGSVTPHHHRVSVYGTKGTFEQAHTGATYLFSRDPGAPREAVCDAYPGIEKGDMLPAFVAHILDGTDAEVSTKEVIDDMSVAFAIDRAVKNGSIEHVKYLDFE